MHDDDDLPPPGHPGPIGVALSVLSRIQRRASDALGHSGIGWGTQRDRLRATVPIPPVVLTPQQVMWLYGHPLGRRICAMPAEEITRAGWSLDAPEQPHLAAGIDERLGVRHEMRRAAEAARRDGVAWVLPITEAAAADPAILAEPRPDDAGPALRLEVYAGREALPTSFDDRLGSAYYGEPLRLDLVPQRSGWAPPTLRAHRSWLIRVPGVAAPGDASAEMGRVVQGADLSALQLYWPALRDYLAVVASGVAASQYAATPHYHAARGIGAQAGRSSWRDDDQAGAALAAKLGSVREMLSTVGMMVTSGEDQFDYRAPSLAGLEHPAAEARSQMAAVEGWSQARIFGDRPAGLGSADEQELDRERRLIEDLQEWHLTRALLELYRRELGELPQGVEVRYMPLAAPDAERDARTDQARAQTASFLTQSLLLSDEEARAYLASGSRLDEQGLPAAPPELPPMDEPPDRAQDSDVPPLPDAARASYRDGIRRHEAGETGDGMQPATVAMARRLAGGANPSRDWLRKAWRWWGRNGQWADADPGTPAYAAAQLWGGRAGERYYRHHGERLFGDD